MTTLSCTPENIRKLFQAANITIPELESFIQTFGDDEPIVFPDSKVIASTIWTIDDLYAGLEELTNDITEDLPDEIQDNVPYHTKADDIVRTLLSDTDQFDRLSKNLSDPSPDQTDLIKEHLIKAAEKIGISNKPQRGTLELYYQDTLLVTFPAYYYQTTLEVTTKFPIPNLLFLTMTFVPADKSPSFPVYAAFGEINDPKPPFGVIINNYLTDAYDVFFKAEHDTHCYVDGLWIKLHGKTIPLGYNLTHPTYRIIEYFSKRLRETIYNDPSDRPESIGYTSYQIDREKHELRSRNYTTELTI